ncbi:Ankyrin_repeat-containing domain superfamily [Hexamita inflata]|uniref:Ankyrin repeat-containing domain superfamily n=1 Tax=Hexamita inflata TaxID=28002 RepID=A0AA86UY07_9EUKA|nr:Ankyrin repeat-containing domain superfamily [Hexamita inflata]
MQADVTIDKYFDAIIENKLQIVKSAPKKYIKRVDKREQSAQIVTNCPSIFYAILYFRNEILNYLLDNKAPIYTTEKFQAQLLDDPEPLDVEKNTSALLFALCVNNAYAVKTLFDSFPELVLKSSKAGTSILELSVRFNNESCKQIWQNVKVLKTLIGHQNKAKLNPLQTACLFGRNEILRFWYKMMSMFDELRAEFFKAALMLNDNFNNIVELAEELIDFEACETTEDDKFDSLDIAQLIMKDALEYAESYKDFDPAIKKLLQQLTNQVEKKPAKLGQLLVVTDTAYNDEEYDMIQNQIFNEKVERMKRGEVSDELE